MPEQVGFTAEHGVATLTVNRPAVRNAIDHSTAQLIAAALDELDRREDLTVGILTGAGEVFSAGMDLKALAETGRRPVTESRGTFGMVERPPQKPLIAAVEGYALGGGFEMVLACDLIVVASNARFALPEVRRGLVAAAGGLLRLPRRLPRAIAMEMVLTGEPLSAERAVHFGLVNRLAEPGGALAAARDLAAAIVAGAPLAVRIAKQIIDVSAEWPMEAAFSRQAPLIAQVRESDDAKEGVRAFVEKRPPRWTGH